MRLHMHHYGAFGAVPSNPAWDFGQLVASVAVVVVLVVWLLWKAADILARMMDR